MWASISAQAGHLSPGKTRTLKTLPLAPGALLCTIPLLDAPADLSARNIVVDRRFHHVFAVVEVLDRSNQPTAGGRVVMLDSTSGTVLRKVNVGNYPNGLAVDEGTGRVLVATVGQVDPMRGDNPTGDG